MSKRPRTLANSFSPPVFRGLRDRVYGGPAVGLCHLGRVGKNSSRNMTKHRCRCAFVCVCVRFLRGDTILIENEYFAKPLRKNTLNPRRLFLLCEPREKRRGVCSNDATLEYKSLDKRRDPKKCRLPFLRLFPSILGVSWGKVRRRDQAQSGWNRERDDRNLRAHIQRALANTCQVPTAAAAAPVE